MCKLQQALFCEYFELFNVIKVVSFTAASRCRELSHNILFLYPFLICYVNKLFHFYATKYYIKTITALTKVHKLHKGHGYCFLKQPKRYSEGLSQNIFINSDRKPDVTDTCACRK